MNITHVATSNLGTYSVTTVRIQEGRKFTWWTQVTKGDAASDPWTSADRDASLVSHDRVCDFVNGKVDAFSRYADFVASALADLESR